MGGVYLGIVADGGYLFATNDRFEMEEDAGAIVRVNRLCGALIVTANGKYLKRVRGVLDAGLSRINCLEEGISRDLARELVEKMEEVFQNEAKFKGNPLPFLLLLVGYSSKEPWGLEHIFIRNRVVDRKNTGGAKEYKTDFEIQSPIPATHLFYGHSGLSEYVIRQVAANNPSLEVMKLLTYYSLREAQKMDQTIFPATIMALVSKKEGFQWVRNEEISRLSSLAQKVEQTLKESLPTFLTYLEGETQGGGPIKS